MSTTSSCFLNCQCQWYRRTIYLGLVRSTVDETDKPIKMRFALTAVMAFGIGVCADPLVGSDADGNLHVNASRSHPGHPAVVL